MTSLIGGASAKRQGHKVPRADVFDCPDTRLHHFGEVKRDCGEMNYDLVILPGGTRQEVADRVAAAYSKIVELNMPADYPVVVPLRESCTFCGRPFTDQVCRSHRHRAAMQPADGPAAQSENRTRCCNGASSCWETRHE